MSAQPPRLDWQTDGADWPNRAASRFVHAAGTKWHLQMLGGGPSALLLHGTAASTHSFAGLMPRLARHLRVVAPDLPGHGFSEAPARSRDLSLSSMSESIEGLLRSLDIEPDIAIGHSAGAAILVRMCVDDAIAPKVIISINGALLPFSSMGRYMFPAMARVLFQNSLVPRFFSWQARGRENVAKVIEGTGSQLSDDELEFYVRLFQNPAHVEAALGMMANWGLQSLEKDMPKLQTPLVMIAASEDQAVPPDKAFQVERLVPQGHVEYVRGLGHLAHEEDPDRLSQLILDIAKRFGVIRPNDAA